jgi:hypothetical protein
VTNFFKKMFSGSPAELIEGRVFGDKNFAKDLINLSGSGAAGAARGINISDEGLNDIRSSIGDYQSRLASGNILPAATRRAYDLAYGRTRDTAARAIAASGAGLKQRQIQAGGGLSAGAAEEYQHMAERDVQDQEFDAETNLGIQMGHDTMSESDKLMDRLDSLKSTILNYGEFQQQLGVSTQIQALLARLNRNNDIAKSMTVVGGMFG